MGALYAWWRDDPLPMLAPLPGLLVQCCTELAGAQHVLIQDPEEVRRRWLEGHRLYLAWIGEQIAAFGWVATRTAEIGELALRFALSPDDRYLWDFLTMPAWRGQGIYPRLLQAILRLEETGKRFWIGHDPSNTASARGILRAGFRKVIQVWRLPNGQLVCTACDDQHAEAGAALLGLPLR
jgi:GNAT superfamily N-acetyltransferase